MKKSERKLSRRNFLVALGAGGASATVALVTKEKEQGTADSAEKTESSRGYRLTEHIRNYYRTAKV